MRSELNLGLQADCERVFDGINDVAVFGRLDGSGILITGGTGFLGSWLCQFLLYVKRRLRIDFKVYLVARDRHRFEERVALLDDLDVEFIRCDVRQLTELPKNVNYIIHAAGVPDNRYHMSNPLETMADIGQGTTAVLRAADRVSDLRMIVHVSSGSVYGTLAEQAGAIDERHPLAGGPLDSIKSVYSEAKRYSEVVCAAARSELRLPIVVVRPFTFIGPFQSLEAPWAINNFIQDGLMGRPIRILGDGKTVRGFLYGADAAGWLLKILLAGKADQVYNIGSPDGHSLLDIAQKVAENFAPKLDVLVNTSLVPTPSQNRYLPDIRKLATELGLKQYTPLELAIAQTVGWYRARSVWDTGGRS